MNALSKAEHGYGEVTRPVKPPRAIEYEVIAKVTHELKTAATRKKSDYPSFVNALHRNTKLWTTLAALVADEANALPAQLRAQIFYLAEFSSRQTAQVLAGGASIGPLLEINTAVLRGLRQERAEQ